MKGFHIVTKKELAFELKIGESTIDRLRTEGLIRSFKIRTQVRFVLEEVVQDLRRAEGQLPLRRIRGTLHRSGGPRVPVKEVKRPSLGPTTIIEPDLEDIDDDL